MLALTFLLLAQAHAPEDLAAQADQAFRAAIDPQTPWTQARRKLQHAAECYRQLADQGAASPGLYLNLGNAEFLLGRPAHALWAYRSGLQVSPHDLRLRRQRDLVRASHPSSAGFDEAFEPTLDDAAWLLGLACALSWSALLWTPARRGLRVGVGVLGLATFGAAVLAGVEVQRRAEQGQHTPLAIVAEEIPLRQGNGPSYDPHPSWPKLSPCAEVRVLHTRGGWMQVQLPTGERGWLPRPAVLIVGQQG